MSSHWYRRRLWAYIRMRFTNALPAQGRGSARQNGGFESRPDTVYPKRQNGRFAGYDTRWHWMVRRTRTGKNSWLLRRAEGAFIDLYEIHETLYTTVWDWGMMLQAFCCRVLRGYEGLINHTGLPSSLQQRLDQHRDDFMQNLPRTIVKYLVLPYSQTGQISQTHHASGERERSVTDSWLPPDITRFQTGLMRSFKQSSKDSYFFLFKIDHESAWQAESDPYVGLVCLVLVRWYSGSDDLHFQ